MATSERHPDRLPLARVVQHEIRTAQLLVEGLQSGAVMPDDPDLLGQRPHERLNMAKLPLVGPVERQNDLVKVPDPFQLLQDQGHRSGLEFGIERGQQEHDRTTAGDVFDFAFQLVDRPGLQSLEHRDGARLPEVRHGGLLS
ncbi:MAG: hypothetical protein MUE48_09530 [Desulfobacterales bacterium]|nr:hypothetical protein [Desulfobacterales bacterium]